MDRAYVDFERLFVFTLCSSFFVVRTKKNILLQRRYSHPVDKSTGVRSDQTVLLTAIESALAYPDPLRRISYFDAATNKRLKFLTNNFALPALTIAQHLQVALADRVVLQVDQAAPADQAVLRYQRERREDANLDRGLGLRTGRDRAQEVGPGGESLPNSTDSQRYPFRENAHFTDPIYNQLNLWDL